MRQLLAARAVPPEAMTVLHADPNAPPPDFPALVQAFFATAELSFGPSDTANSGLARVLTNYREHLKAVSVDYRPAGDRPNALTRYVGGENLSPDEGGVVVLVAGNDLLAMARRHYADLVANASNLLDNVPETVYIESLPVFIAVYVRLLYSFAVT